MRICHAECSAEYYIFIFNTEKLFEIFLQARGIKMNDQNILKFLSFNFIPCLQKNFEQLFCVQIKNTMEIKSDLIILVLQHGSTVSAALTELCGNYVACVKKWLM